MLCAPVKNDGRYRQRVYGSGGIVTGALQALGSIAAALIRGKTPVEPLTVFRGFAGWLVLVWSSAGCRHTVLTQLTGARNLSLR